MRAIVIGKTGQVSRALAKVLPSDTIFTSSKVSQGSKPLDLSQEKSISDFFSSLDPHEKFTLYLVGALTHVDRCETEQDLCRTINHVGPTIIAQECAKRGIPVCFFSTEYVYGGAEYEGGRVGPFSETDEPYPSSFYGKCKLEAEKSILALNSDSLVIRTTMVYSWDPTGMNFLMQYIRQLEKIKNNTVENQYLIPNDQVSNPTDSGFLANTAKILMDQKRSGIWNVVGADRLSREELLRKIAQRFGYQNLDLNVGFRFLATKEIKQAAKRPLNAGLTTEKLASIGIEAPKLEESFTAISCQM